MCILIFLYLFIVTLIENLNDFAIDYFRDEGPME